MAERWLCPQCFSGGVLDVSRPELVRLARAAGVRLVRPRGRFRRGVAGYWWCPACESGGAFYEWTALRRGA